MDILNWWLNTDPLTDNERDLLFKERPIDKIFVSKEEYENLEDEYFKRMPFCNIDSASRVITFSECATNFINYVFDTYIDDDTLVIYSNCEHPNVEARVKNCKNVLQLNHYMDIRPLNISKIVTEAKKYKKVFVYIIGTQISNGEITPQEFFIKLKNSFIKNNIDHKFFLDDVHGMFFVPRDYSLFDFILFTAHAVIDGYDMGIFISKTGEFGEKVYNWGKTYLEMLDVILKRKEKIFYFYEVMSEHFAKLLSTNDFQLLSRVSPHLFSMKVINKLPSPQRLYEKLHKIYIRLENDGENIKYILLRGAWFVKRPEFLEKGLKMLDDLLSFYGINQ